MCPLKPEAWSWALLALSALLLVWQAGRFTQGSPAARLALAGWAAWLGAMAWALAAARTTHPVVAGTLGALGLGWLAFTAWVVYRDWRAATHARRAAEEAIDRHMQAELQRVFDAHVVREDEKAAGG